MTVRWGKCCRTSLIVILLLHFIYCVLWIGY